MSNTCVQLSGEVRGFLFDAARQLGEREQCGLLFGQIGESVFVERIIQALNVRRSQHAFGITRLALERARVLARPFDYVGVFHSHPASDGRCGLESLSESDRRGIERTGNVWLVQSTQGVEAFRYDSLMQQIITMEILYDED